MERQVMDFSDKVIWGITGGIGAGKSLAARYIRDIINVQRDETVDIFAVADSVRDVVSVMFDVDVKRLRGDTPEDRYWREHGILSVSDGFDFWTPREALQFVGTELFRKNLHQDFWIYKLKQKMAKSESKHIIVPDIRFDNEMDFIFESGGKMLYLKRPGDDARYSVRKETDTHESERGITRDLWPGCYMMINGGDKIQLKNRCESFVRRRMSDDYDRQEETQTQEGEKAGGET